MSVHQATRPRVLLVVNTLPPHDLSGVGEQVVQLAAGLEEVGIEPEILGRGRGGARGPKVIFPLTVVLPALVRLWKGRYAAVQVHESDGGALLLALWLLRSVLRVRRVALLQVSYDEEARSVRPLRDADGTVLAEPEGKELRFRRWRTPLQRLLGRWSARCADVVLVPSEQTGREIVRDYGPCSPEVLPNAAAMAGLTEAAPARGAHLLYVGRLRIRKGLEILLHALARLRERGVVASLRIAGDGEREDSLQRLVDRLGLEEAVTFLGRCGRDRVQEELSACRALVVPSIYEGMPLVILEAMEAGRAVVASAVSGIPEVVVDGETGWLVPPEDVRALTDALAEVMASAEEARRRGSAGRRRVDRYRPAAVAARWREVVLAGESPPRSGSPAQ